MDSAAASAPTAMRPPDSSADGLRDLVEGFKLSELWTTLAWHEIRQRYRRSIVGPFWLTISMALFIGGLATLYGGLFGQNMATYLPYVATGMIVFSLISQIIVEGTTVFIASGPVILQLKAPLSIYVFQMLWRNILIFAHNIVIYIFVLMVFPVPIGWNLLLAFAGLFLVMLAGVWLGLILGTLSARFRDVPPIVASLMQVALFLTPVFWLADSLPNRELFVWLNPLYYFLEIVRMPLLGQTPPAFLWLVVIGLNCLCALVAVVFYSRYRARIAFWI